MRIRKRQVPLPLSSLSPIPLSDPLLSRSPVVQLQLDSTPHQISPSFASQPSDQPIGGPSNGPDCSDATAAGPPDEKKVLLGKDERWGGGGEEGERSKCYNDTRGGGISFGAKQETALLVPQQSPSSLQGVVRRWGEGQGEVIPLKKRRGSFEKRSNEEIATVIEEKEKKMLKTKVSKKYVQGDGIAGKKEENESKEVVVVVDGRNAGNGSCNGGGKKRGRGGALMEGSRCSRVNGRGWRCCQQTLVGYSLCEHHLGKGRLRSMTSVRSRSMATATSATVTTNATKDAESSEPLPISSPSLSLEEKETMRALSEDGKIDIDIFQDEEYGDGETMKVGAVSTKKKVKLGVVKARSISSLLGQANNAVTIAVAENSK